MGDRRRGPECGRRHAIAALAAATTIGVLGSGPVIPASALALARPDAVGPEAPAALGFGVLPYLPATELDRRFAPLIHALGARLGRPIVLSVAPDHTTLVHQVGRDQIPLAYIGPAPYVAVTEHYGRKHLLGRLEVGGQAAYHGVLAVAEASPISDIADLRGRRIAFIDRKSTMGFLLPLYLLHQAGLSLADLETYEFVGGHRNAALGVLTGGFDAAAIKADLFDEYQHRGLRAIATTPAVPEQLFIATAGLPPDLLDPVRQALADLGRHRDGLAVLSHITDGVTGLVAAADDDLDELRAVLNELRRLGEWAP